MDSTKSQVPFKFELDLYKWVSKPPYSSELCHGCGALFDKAVSSTPRQADWQVSFLLQCAVKFVSALGLQPETIISRLSKQIGGRMSHFVDSNENICTD